VVGDSAWDDDQNRAKRAALDAWIQGVNQRRGFGRWHAAVAFAPEEVEVILKRHVKHASKPAEPAPPAT
jgi:type III restriction enzyme